MNCSKAKAEMEKIRDLPGEIEKLQKYIDDPPLEYVNQFYKDYRTGRAKNKSISEYAVDEEKLNKVKYKQALLIQELARLVIDAERLLDHIDNSYMRVILRMYYINGNTMAQVAKALKCSEANISKLIKRFWNNPAGYVSSPNQRGY